MVLVSSSFSLFLRLFSVIVPMRRLLAWRLDAAVLAFASSSFSLSGSLRPSSQVSRAALGLLRYDGLERAQLGHPEVLVSSCFSPLRRELPVVREMSPSSQVSRGALAARFAL